MEMFNKYKSPLGYQTGENHIDSYGVDHSKQMINNFNQQGITKGYPQYGTNFWGSSPDNNFGFGTSQISSNIENMQNTPVPNVKNHQVLAIQSTLMPE